MALAQRISSVAEYGTYFEVRWLSGSALQRFYSNIDMFLKERGYGWQTRLFFS